MILPFHFGALAKEFKTSREGRWWGVKLTGSSGAEAMSKLWERLRELGLGHDMAAQKALSQDEDPDREDPDHPLWRKLSRMIPEIRAKKEASALSKACSGASLAPARKKAPGL